MDIRYHKRGSITIKNKDVDILIGADFSQNQNYDQKVWIANPRLVTVDYGSVGNEKLLINGVGEYETGGVEIIGYKYDDDKRFYVIDIDEYKVGVLFEDGDIEQISSKAESLDVLVVLSPMFGIEKKLETMIKKTGVSFLILVGNKLENKGCLDVFDREDITPTSKFVLKNGQEIGEGLEIVLLSDETV